MGLKVISFIDCNGNVFLKEKLTSLPIKEECIINKSIELFGDCEPCIIHRTYVMKMIYFEIDDYFEKVLKDGEREISSESIPGKIISLLELKDRLQRVYIS
jgi:hypothetical protein